MIKQTNGLAGDFKKLHMQELKLYVKFFEDKLKDNQPFSLEDVNEGVEKIRDKLNQIRELEQNN